MVREIPLNTVRGIIKEYWEGEISQECIEIVKDRLMDVLKDIIEKTIELHKEENNKRSMYSLRHNKRISKYIIDRAIDKVFKQIDVLEYQGKLGQHNRDTSLSKEAIEVV